LKEELPSIETLCADLADWKATKAVPEPWSEKIDLLVNNAALAECCTLEEITEETFDRQYAITDKPVINVTQTVVKGMKKRKSGSIVNVSSVAGLIGLKDHMVYGGTKAALDLSTKIMALELDPYGIRVNSVNPTVTWTEMAMVGW